VLSGCNKQGDKENCDYFYFLYWDYNKGTEAESEGKETLLFMIYLAEVLFERNFVNLKIFNYLQGRTKHQ